MQNILEIERDLIKYEINKCRVLQQEIEGNLIEDFEVDVIDLRTPKEV